MDNNMNNNKEVDGNSACIKWKSCQKSKSTQKNNKKKVAAMMATTTNIADTSILIMHRDKQHRSDHSDCDLSWRLEATILISRK